MKNFVAISLFLRLSSIIFVSSWFVPDEYWQSLEIAHLWSFGYGYKTWEWVYGIRSTLHPFVFYLLYEFLKYSRLDYVFLLITLPRIFQALLSCYADYCLYKWSAKCKLFTFLLLTSWFWYYTCSRTLINTFEMCLTSISLRFFPWKKNQHNNNGLFISLSCLICCIRPTALTIWAPLYLYHIFYISRTPVQVIMKKYIPIGLTVLLSSILIDSILYGKLTITAWNFFQVNCLRKVSSFYGVEPWFWYITSGLLVLLGTHYALLIAAIFYTNLRSPTLRILWFIISFNVIIFSVVPHKEFRFLLPLMPIFLYVISISLSRVYRKTPRFFKKIIITILLSTNVMHVIYFGTIHQSGTTNLMTHLNQIMSSRRNVSILFLMPCHSTPFYSHIHRHVDLRILTCEPNLMLKSNYKDETNIFYENPEKWLMSQPIHRISPDYVIHFDNLSTNISTFFQHNYKLHSKLFHTHFPNNRISENIIILSKNQFL